MRVCCDARSHGGDRGPLSELQEPSAPGVRVVQLSVCLVGAECNEENGRRHGARSYSVRASWFEILLPSLQMRTTVRVPPALRAKAEYTLKRLKLRDGERIVRWRQKWYERYQRGLLTLDGLRDVAPLIADAVERQAASTPKSAAKARKPAPKARTHAPKARTHAPGARKRP